MATSRSTGAPSRRLAKDLRALHTQPLPLYYLWPASASAPTSLTSFTILLTGPPGTPYASSLFNLHLTMPPTYPASPPKAFFRTPIFHPNVEPRTGAVCLETLARGWTADTTLRDVLATIACLLIQPNPDSALNEEAGKMLQQAEDGYAAFCERARLLAGVHARIPAGMREAVQEALRRGEEEREYEGGVEREHLEDAEDSARTGMTVTELMTRQQEVIPADPPEANSENSESSPDEHEANDENAENEDKENDASLSPTPVFTSAALPLRTGMKRPLSDLPAMALADDREYENERNIAANTKQAGKADPTPEAMPAARVQPVPPRQGLAEITTHARVAAPPAKRLATARARLGIRRL